VLCAVILNRLTVLLGAWAAETSDSEDRPSRSDQIEELGREPVGGHRNLDLDQLGGTMSGVELQRLEAACRFPP
jgi:hypothetical protein